MRLKNRTGIFLSILLAGASNAQEPLNEISTTKRCSRYVFAVPKAWSGSYYSEIRHGTKIYPNGAEICLDPGRNLIYARTTQSGQNPSYSDPFIITFNNYNADEDNIIGWGDFKGATEALNDHDALAFWNTFGALFGMCVSPNGSLYSPTNGECK